MGFAFVFVVIPSALLSFICNVIDYPKAIWIILAPPIALSAIMNLVSIIYRLFNKRRNKNLPVVKEE